MVNCSKTPVVHETQCTLYVIEIHVICYCWKCMCHKYDKCNVTVYDMYKVYNTEDNSHQKWKYPYECQYMMKDMNINEQFLHDYLSCPYASRNWHEIHKKLCQTIYITQMEKKYKA